jgi:P-type Cu+ transporter
LQIQLKESSQEAIRNIEKMKIKTAMITGDNERTAKAIAKKIGLDYVISDVLPEGKVDEDKKTTKEIWICCNGRRWYK